MGVKRQAGKRIEVGLAVGLMITVAGCVAAKKTNTPPPTQADLLIQAYPEIQNGRLLIVADFEDEKQMGIFQLESATNPGRLARDPAKGRPESGAAALAVTFSGPNESILITNSRESEWSLQRDWRPYDLLMLAVNSPTPGLALEIKIVGGVSGHAVEARTETALGAGWNLLRFDLAEIGESVPLDDIQEIRLALVDPPANPVPLHFDDILLAGNRHDLLGDSANTSGSLYVQSAGRHWNIGAGGRFEISFRNGQITRWFNLAADPYRLRNLVRGTSLGPVPVQVDASGALTPANMRGAVSARQRIMEMNEIRVVIDSIWQSDSNGASGAPASFEHWTYTIYPTGQLFVSATASTNSSMAINMAWSPNAPSVHIAQTATPQENANSGSRVASFALAQFSEANAALLLVPYPDPESTLLKEVVDTANRTASIIWSKPTANDPSQTWKCQLLLASAGLDPNEAAARAIDYTTLDSVRIEIGAPHSAPGLRPDGFDPGTGTHHIATDGNRARIVVEGKKKPAFAPVFQIDGGSQDQVWVYVNYLLHTSVIRGQRGEALFQVPGTITKEIVVEPLFKQSAGNRP